MTRPVPAPLLSADSFRRSARQFGSGVGVVTTQCRDEVYGKTVSSFNSLSIDPLLVSVAITTRSPIVEAIRESDVFAISLLHADQVDISRYFSQAGSGGPSGGIPFPGAVGYTGAPVIEGCLSYFDCERFKDYQLGDHTLLVGHVVATGHTPGAPLLYYDGSYRGVGDWIHNHDYNNGHHGSGWRTDR